MSTAFSVNATEIIRLREQSAADDRQNGGFYDQENTSMSGPEFLRDRYGNKSHRFPSMVSGAPSATSMAACWDGMTEHRLDRDRYGNLIGRGNLLTTLIQ